MATKLNDWPGADAGYETDNRHFDDTLFQTADYVNHPPHYTAGTIECIDAIRAALGPEGFKAFCRGNSIKYLWRYNRKGGNEDLEKAIWYTNKLISENDNDAELT